MLNVTDNIMPIVADVKDPDMVVTDLFSCANLQILFIRYTF